MSRSFQSAIDVFVHGFSLVKGRTHPRIVERIGPLWRMHDAPRANPKNLRKDEWVATDIPAATADAIAGKHSQGRFFISAIVAGEIPIDETRADYKRLGYRLIATEPFFVHPLQRIPRRKADVRIERMRTEEQARRLGAATRTRPVGAELLTADAPIRQYLAMHDGELAGWVASVTTRKGNWCSGLYVRPEFRRRGIAAALLCRMLREDRTAGVSRSVLLSSHTGALLYPAIGYEQIGMLLILAPPKENRRS